jgi:ABC-type multidrug transport system ATPase subunit
VLLCSHLLPDVERTCDHVVVIDQGRAVIQGPLADLTGGGGDGSSVRVRARDPGGRLAAALEAAGRRVTADPDGSLRVSADTGEADVDALFALAAELDTPLQAVEAVRSTLDQVFMDVLRRQPAAEEDAL